MYSALNAALTLVLAIWSTLKATEWIEAQGLWTLRLRLATLQHWFSIPTAVIIWSLLGYQLVLQCPETLRSFRLFTDLLFVVGSWVALFGCVMPAYEGREYLRLRWKAWTGPSRTGIKADLVSYIGDRRDWKTLHALSRGKISMHPVDFFSNMSFLSPHRLIDADPTDLLLAQSITDQKENTKWITSSDVRDSVYQPIRLGGRAVSLLWGDHIGFQRRCSRGIISVPRDLLVAWPKIAGGLDARGICLACGILARNKGLNPISFICNLQGRDSITIFEQNSLFWPRPAKTLRSLFRVEFEKYFSTLGPVFVTVATELALLLTDVPIRVAEDWLQGRLEHQDIELNNQAYRLGADDADLERLYQGHYAAMLVSLSVHRIGVRIRPELFVYRAICLRKGEPLGAWAKSDYMENRRQRELEALGPRILHLIDAIV